MMLEFVRVYVSVKDMEKGNTGNMWPMPLTLSPQIVIFISKFMKCYSYSSLQYQLERLLLIVSFFSVTEQNHAQTKSAVDGNFALL